MIESITNASWLPLVLRLAGVIGLAWIIHHFGKIVVDRIVRKAIRPDGQASAKAEKAREDTIIAIFEQILKITVITFGLMICLSLLGVNVAPLIAAASILGIAIGFGGQAIVRDFLAGVFIILENQYRVGDSVSIAGYDGTVEAITVRTTILRDSHGNKHHIPNGEIKTSTNKSMDFNYVYIELILAQTTRIETVRKLTAQATEKLLKEPDCRKQIIKPPEFVRVGDINPGGVHIQIKGKVRPGQQWFIAGVYREILKSIFDRNGVKIAPGPWIH